MDFMRLTKRKPILIVGIAAAVWLLTGVVVGSDYAVEFSPALKLLKLLGPIDGRRGLHISSAYVLAFFDTTLRHKESPLLQGSSTDFPEAKFEVRRPF